MLHGRSLLDTRSYTSRALFTRWLPWPSRDSKLILAEGLRPSDSPTRSLARRFAGALRSRGSLAAARSLPRQPRRMFVRYALSGLAQPVAGDRRLSGHGDPCPSSRPAPALARPFPHDRRARDPGARDRRQHLAFHGRERRPVEAAAVPGGGTARLAPNLRSGVPGALSVIPGQRRAHRRVAGTLRRVRGLGGYQLADDDPVRRGVDLATGRPDG